MATTITKIPKSLHIVTLDGGKKIGMLLPEVYNSIGDLVGVKKATDAEGDNADLEDVVSAIKSGKVIRFRVRAVKNEKTVTRNLIASASKVQVGNLNKITDKVLETGAKIKGNGYIPAQRKFAG